MRISENFINDIVSASLYAKAYGIQIIDNRFVLLALASDEGKAKEVLENNGIDSESIAEIISSMEGTSPDLSSIGSDAEENPGKIMNMARLETRRLLSLAETKSTSLGNHGIIFPEHVLLAMLSSKTDVSYRMLESLSADVGGMTRTLSDYMISIAGEQDMAPQNADDDDGGDLNPEEERASSRRRRPANRDRAGKGQKGGRKTLDKFGKNLTKKAQEGGIDPVIGREEEINRVMQILARRTKNNPCLVGEPGVGKTAIAEGLALKIANGDVPEILRNKTVYSIDMGSMVAGSRYRGDFEERIKNLLEEVAADKDVILFIDEIHTLIGAGSGEGTLDAANIMKPMLTKNELQLIGATTLDEYSKVIEKDSALERRFQKVMVNEPSEEEAILILKGLRGKYEEHHKISIPDDVIEQAVKLSVRYLSDRFLPDKAIDLIDEAAARKRINVGADSETKKLNSRLEEVIKQKTAAAQAQEFEKAQEFKNEENQIKAQLEAIKNSSQPDKDGFTGTLSVDDIADVLAKWSGIPVQKITEGDAEKLKNLEEELKKRVIGQDEAVKSIAKAIRRSRLGLKDPSKPSGSFIFLGTTGVGKTELAKALAEVMFGDENALVRIDMSEYMEKHDVSKLIGSPPGYVGYDDGGQLTEKVRRHPYSVVLFDEIEKAHPDIFNSMLQILDDGRLTDGKGRLVDFKNTIIIMTSNIGARLLTGEVSHKIGFGFGDENDKDEMSREKLYGGKSYDEAKKLVLEEVKKSFSPEFVNRVDEIIFFRMLGRDALLSIVDLLTAQVGKRVNELGITIELTESAKEVIAKKGYDPQYGARPLKRVIQAMVEDKFSEALLDNVIAPGDIAIVDGDGDDVVIRNGGKAEADNEDIKETITT